MEAKFFLHFLTPVNIRRRDEGCIGEGWAGRLVDPTAEPVTVGYIWRTATAGCRRLGAQEKKTISIY